MAATYYHIHNPTGFAKLYFSITASDEKKPQLLLACYFNLPDYSCAESLSPNHPTNMFITVGPDAKINPDNSIVQVSRKFKCSSL